MLNSCNLNTQMGKIMPIHRNPAEKSNKFMNVREQIIAKNSWVLLADEKAKLDHFFLQHDIWENLEKDFYVDQQELKRYLRHDGKEYEVILIQPVRQLQSAKDLGLSFRVHNATGIRVVLIKEWYVAEDRNGATTQEASRG